MSPRRNVFRIGFWFVLFGLLMLAWSAGCVAPPATTGWLGLNTCMADSDFMSSENSGPYRQATFDLVAESGTHKVRDRLMDWSRIQPAAGQAFDFSSVDDYVRGAQEIEAEILAVCAGIPQWAAGARHRTIPDRQHSAAFVDFVHRFVERYDGDGKQDMKGLKRPVRAYEFLSDIERIPAGEYAYWLRIFYETVKSADSRAFVVLGGLKSPGMKRVDFREGDYHHYFEQLLAAEQLEGSRYPYFDVVGFCQYPQVYPGRTPFTDALAYLRETMAVHDRSLPIWLCEVGSIGNAKMEDYQAADVVKWAVQARTLGVERYYVQGLWDGHREGDRNERMGLVQRLNNNELRRKPAFYAFTTLLEELKERPRVDRKDEGFYRLSGHESFCFVVWKEESYDSTPMTMPGWWKVRSVTGRHYSRQGAALTLGYSPLFLQKITSPFIK